MNHSPVRIFCIGLHADLATGNTPEEFSAWIESAVSEVRPLYRTGATSLLVFPEYCTLPLVHDQDSLRHFGTASFDFFSGLAVRESAYVLACGPIIYDGRIYNQATLYDPTGHGLLSVRKQNLTDEERTLGLSADTKNTPNVVTLPFGTVGIAICLDAFSSSYVADLADQGAEILLMPSANPQTWAAPAEDSGVWQPLEWAAATTGAVSNPESSIKWLINPMLRGGAQFDRGFDGQSAIIRRSTVPVACPYNGVDRTFTAAFPYCGPDASVQAHSIGMVDLE